MVRTCVWYCEDMSTPIHTRAASAQPQTPGCAARRNEVSLRESALDSHTRPLPFISLAHVGLVPPAPDRLAKKGPTHLGRVGSLGQPPALELGQGLPDGVQLLDCGPPGCQQLS